MSYLIAQPGLKDGRCRHKLPLPLRELPPTPCRLCGRRADLCLWRLHQRAKELCVLLIRLDDGVPRRAHRGRRRLYRG